MIRRFTLTACATAVALGSSFAAEASDDLDSCPIVHHQRLQGYALLQSTIDAALWFEGTDFGISLAASGTSAVVGEPHRRIIYNSSGAAIAYRRSGRQWLAQQLLSPIDGDTEREFGASVALDADTLAVGAPGGFSAGAVYMYSRQGDLWQHTQKLTALDPAFDARFGQAVALMGDTLLVGATRTHGGAPSSGAAYVFRFNGQQWVQQYKLISSDSATNDELGSVVALEGETAIVASVKHNNGAGAAYVYRIDAFNGNGWIMEQKLTSPTQQAGAQFGRGLALQQGVAYVGAPKFKTVPPIQTGAVFSFEQSDGQWTLAQTLVAPDAAAADQFGTALVVEEGTLVISAPGDDVQHSPELPPTMNAGSGYVFGPEDGQWMFQRKLVPREQRVGTANGGTNSQIGQSIALSDGLVLMGAPSDGWPAGSVVLFDLAQPTCDGGEADPCDRDRNNNLLNDRCEITTGLSADCNGDGIPDEARAAATYAIDPGIFGSVTYFASSRDILWLNQFTVQSGGEHVTHIAVAWPGATLADWPAFVVLFADPNNDRDPSDAVLLGAWPVRTVTLWGWDVYHPFTYLAIDRTYVGPPGQSFFVGAFISLPPYTHYALAGGSTLPKRSWYMSAPPGTASLADIHTFGAPNFITSGRWGVRALSLDCNGNGAWDSCDIESGASLDRNLNGIPDECEPCLADIEPRPGGDGEVNFDDLLSVIGAWGVCDGCPQDISGDGEVDFDDVLAVIFAWGACG